ncbi:hypothetical protein Tco_0705529 [Tanacetum coccineum]|uniref:Uncharacterized protein n=1 Tax=Tanacetum coccineum TaxID=301880 RepID=A0ABQ4Y4U7_9ASTR
MGDEHLSTIQETESNELIKSSVGNLVPTPSESKDLSKDLSDIESECNVPVYDDFTTVYNPLFDADNDFSSSDDKWNGYLRKGRKTKPKRQNRTRNGKAWKRQSQDKAQV